MTNMYIYIRRIYIHNILQIYHKIHNYIAGLHVNFCFSLEAGKKNMSDFFVAFPNWMILISSLKFSLETTWVRRVPFVDGICFPGCFGL